MVAEEPCDVAQMHTAQYWMVVKTEKGNHAKNHIMLADIHQRNKMSAN